MKITTHQNLGCCKTVLRRKFIALKRCLTSFGKEEKSEINIFNFHFKKLEKDEQIKPKVKENNECQSGNELNRKQKT